MKPCCWKRRVFIEQAFDFSGFFLFAPIGVIRGPFSFYFESLRINDYRCGFRRVEDLARVTSHGRPTCGCQGERLANSVPQVSA